MLLARLVRVWVRTGHDGRIGSAVCACVGVRVCVREAARVCAGPHRVVSERGGGVDRVGRAGRPWRSRSGAMRGRGQSAEGVGEWASELVHGEVVQAGARGYKTLVPLCSLLT